MVSISDYFLAIPTALQSSYSIITYLKWSFVGGIGIFVLSLPLLRGRTSFFDVAAARKALKYLRCIIILEIVCLCILSYFYITYGNTIQRHAALSYGNGDSWIYGYGRPSAGIILLCFGFFSDMHPGTRYFCILGCIVEACGDAISAYQVFDYIRQMHHESAPSNGLSTLAWNVYLWRDIVSFGLCILILFVVSYLSCILGFCHPQLIHPSVISGDDFDRYGVMHRLRNERKLMVEAGIVESKSAFSDYWYALQRKKDKVDNDDNFHLLSAATEA